MEQLLTLFNRFSRLVKEAFQDDPRFLTARDKVSLAWAVSTTTPLINHTQFSQDCLRTAFLLQAYKAVVNDATIFKLELPMKQKG